MLNQEKVDLINSSGEPCAICGTDLLVFMRRGNRCPTGKLYLIYNSRSDLTKIGISTDVSKRVRSLEQSVGESLYLIAESSDVVHPKFWEDFLHRQFIEKRRLGEWFQLELGEINRMKSMFNDGWPFLDARLVSPKRDDTWSKFKFEYV